MTRPRRRPRAGRPPTGRWAAAPVTALVLAVTGALAGCPAPASEDPFELVIAAKKAAADVRADGARVAYTDGLEASSDGQGVGVDVVVAERGEEILRAPADVAVRGMALGKTSVATLELAEAAAVNQHVVIRPLDGGDAIDVPRTDAPLALAAVDDGAGYLWIEARLDGTDDTGGGVDGLYVLTLVEAGEDGVVTRRTPFDAGEIRAPAAVLELFPRPFGVLVAGDDVYFGWDSDLCRGGSVLYRVSRADGHGVAEWRGRVAAVGPVDGTTCECDTTVADNVTDRGQAVALDAGTPVVVGGVFDCASVSAERGFVRDGEDSAEVEDALRFAGFSSSGVTATTPTGVVKLVGVGEGAVVNAHSRVTGLAVDGGDVFFSLEDGVYRLTP